MLWARTSRGVPNGEDVQKLVASGDLLALKDDPREAAQELAFQALEANDGKWAHFLARQAVHVDPSCADARRVLADIDASSHVDRVGRLKKALMDEEERLGAVRAEFAGRLSDAVEARPYLRTRFDLAVALWAAGRRKRGNGHLETLFADDAPDVLGVRYPLLMARLAAGDADGVGLLLDHEDTAQADLIVRWARVLQRVLAGEEAGAEALYRELREGREAETDSLATPPAADFAYPGFFRDDIHLYAALCLSMLHNAWHAHPVAAAWLRDHVVTSTGGPDSRPSP